MSSSAATVVCPNCLIELDEYRYCNGCGITLRSGATGAQPPRVESLDKGFPGSAEGRPATFGSLRSEATGAQPAPPGGLTPLPERSDADASHPSTRKETHRP